MIDKLKRLNHEELKTPYEIERETGISYDDLRQLFEDFGIDLLRLPEISVKKRAKHFDVIYQLHFVNKLSLNQIYTQYGFSPPYSIRVLGDKGLKHLGFVNQLKK